MDSLLHDVSRGETTPSGSVERSNTGKWRDAGIVLVTGWIGVVGSSYLYINATSAVIQDAEQP